MVISPLISWNIFDTELLLITCGVLVFDCNLLNNFIFTGLFWFKVFGKLRLLISLIAYFFSDGKYKFGNGVKSHDWFNSLFDESVELFFIVNFFFY